MPAPGARSECDGVGGVSERGFGRHAGVILSTGRTLARSP
jgi:hypothetical protein